MTKKAIHNELTTNKQKLSKQNNHENHWCQHVKGIAQPETTGALGTKKRQTISNELITIDVRLATNS